MSTKTAPRELPLATSKDQILAVDDRATEIVDVPEWGVRVTVRALSGTERDSYEGGFISYRKNEKGGMEVAAVQTANIRARLVALSIVDEAGVRLFSEKDVLALGDKSAAALERVFKVSQRLSGLTNEDVEALSAGLKADLNGSSGSD